MRKKIYKFVHEKAPNYHCPFSLECHVSSPNKNCFYYEGVEKEVYPYDDCIFTYEDSLGFCPPILDFINFIFDNLKKKKNFSKDEHSCEDWKYKPFGGEYYDCEFKEKVA